MAIRKTYFNIFDRLKEIHLPSKLSASDYCIKFILIYGFCFSVVLVRSDKITGKSIKTTNAGINTGDLIWI